MSHVKQMGRLGNHIVRNVAFHFIAKKHDLYTDYHNYEITTNLGIELHVGKNKYNRTKPLRDNNYFSILDASNIDYNLDPNKSYFQTRANANLMHNHLNSDSVMQNVIERNKFKDRYKNNNDCFVHIRLGDVAKYNPGFAYYDKALSSLSTVDKIYIATDTDSHPIILKLKTKYPNVIMLGNDLQSIIQFGSTCKYVILSYGTFSVIIGYLSYYSTVFRQPYCAKYCWDWNNKMNNECDMFLNKSTKVGPWIEIKDF
tara:strand:+ start:140 stop:910 length:771 start_codon:yes stop_codon:yes gene_type:complete